LVKILTEDNEENEWAVRQETAGELVLGGAAQFADVSKRKFVTFCLIRSLKDHPGDAVLEHRLVEIDEQSDRHV